MATNNFVSQVFDRVGDLISELNHRLIDGSIMNADVPSYLIRLDASINNIQKLVGRVSSTVYHEIITGIQELKNLLSQTEQTRQPERAGYGTPRTYTGHPGQSQFNISRNQLEFLVELNLSGSQIANLLGVSE